MFDDNIGKHCTNCNMKDYLPWKCERDCKKYFCDECYRNHKCWDYLTNSEKTQIAVQNILESDKHKIETKKLKGNINALSKDAIL